MKMYELDDGSFFFDEPVEVAICPICDEPLYIEPYRRVMGQPAGPPVGVGEWVHASYARSHIHCKKCRHRVEVFVPCTAWTMPLRCEVVRVRRWDGIPTSHPSND